MKFYLSLKTKLALAFTVSSIAAMVIVGVVANLLSERHFKNVADDRMFLQFKSDVIDYHREYDLTSDEHLTLPQWFAMKRDLNERGELVTGNLLQRPPARFDTHTEPSFKNPPPREIGPLGAESPKGRRANPQEPVDPYILFSNNNKVLLGAGIYSTGSVITDERDIKAAVPIEYDDEVIAYAFPISTVGLNDQEQGYLTALRASLMWATIPAIAFALLIAFYLSRYFCSQLDQVMDALIQLGEGDFENKIKLEVNSRDEFSKLAKTFNKISDKLALSNEKIVSYAQGLSELSHRDELTGLHNRRYVNQQASDHIARSERYARPLSIAMTDIDNFKIINDTYGHKVGDDVLKAIGEILHDNLREFDVIGRYGGEEFVVIFPETTGDKALALANRVRLAIADFDWEAIAEGLKVTISTGLSTNVSLHSFEGMLKAADKNLYQAKNSGKNRVIA